MLKNLLKFTLILTPAIGVCQSKYDMGAATIVENYRQAVTLNSAAYQPDGNEVASLIVSITDASVLDQTQTAQRHHNKREQQRGYSETARKGYRGYSTA